MIDWINLTNFQSHKDSLLEFHPGVNAIVGPSDNGKSAILRGLYLTRYNQPSGDAFVSKWARDEKGKQKKQMNVTVGKGTSTLTRGKGPDLNGYQFDEDDPLEALGKGGLPLQVVDWFNTTEVNIQEQMDRPFLIASTPPEIAKFLNGIVDMSEIDLYLSAAESKKRANTKDVKRVGQEIKDLEKDIFKFLHLPAIEKLSTVLNKVESRREAKQSIIQTLSEDIDTKQQLVAKLSVWSAIDDLDGFLKKIVKVKDRISEKESDLDKLDSSISDYTKFSNIVSNTKNILEISKLLKQIEKLHEEIDDYTGRAFVLNTSIANYKKGQDILSKSIDTKKLSALLKQIKKVKTEKTEKNNIVKALKVDNLNYVQSRTFIESSETMIQNLEKQLPKTCPTCKQAWHKGGHS